MIAALRKPFRLWWPLLAVILLSPATGVSSPIQKSHAAKVAVLENDRYIRELIRGIRGAKSEITGCFFLFKVTSGRGNLPMVVVDELVAARKRGVAVTIELEQDSGGKGTVYEQNRRAAALLTDGGVTVRFDVPKTTTHVKAMVIDRRYVYLGSHNLTQSALRHNNELSVMIDSPELAAEVSGYLKGL